MNDQFQSQLELHPPTRMSTERIDILSRFPWLWKEYKGALEAAWAETNALDAENGWYQTKAKPSEIHVELLKEGKIKDPYVGFNEHNVQCK